MSPKAKAAMTTIALAAAERLSDPKVRAQLAQQGRQLAEQAKAWRTERSERSGDPARTHSRRLRRMEARAAKLRSSIARLGKERPDLAEALQAPTALLDEVHAALAVADQLPNDKRRQAAGRVADELDRLEQLVLDAALPTGRAPGTA